MDATTSPAIQPWGGPIHSATPAWSKPRNNISSPTPAASDSSASCPSERPLNSGTSCCATNCFILANGPSGQRSKHSSASSRGMVAATPHKHASASCPGVRPSSGTHGQRPSNHPTTVASRPRPASNAKAVAVNRVALVMDLGSQVAEFAIATDPIVDCQSEFPNLKSETNPKSSDAKFGNSVGRASNATQAAVFWGLAGARPQPPTSERSKHGITEI